MEILDNCIGSDRLSLLKEIDLQENDIESIHMSIDG